MRNVYVQHESNMISLMKSLGYSFFVWRWEAVKKKKRQKWFTSALNHLSNCYQSSSLIHNCKVKAYQFSLRLTAWEAGGLHWYLVPTETDEHAGGGWRDREWQLLRCRGKLAENKHSHKKPLSATICWLGGWVSLKWRRAQRDIQRQSKRVIDLRGKKGKVAPYRRLRQTWKECVCGAGLPQGPQTYSRGINDAGSGPKLVYKDTHSCFITSGSLCHPGVPKHCST